MRLTSWQNGRIGQALVEFALVFPIFLLVLLSVIILGLFVFYGQQLSNASREAARYAAVHSTTAQCPTVSRLDPISSNSPSGYFRCDPPETGWPKMTAHGRSFIWALEPSGVGFSACWSGYVSPTNFADALPGSPNTFVDCSIGGVNPRTSPDDLTCPPPATVAPSAPYLADGDDKASSIAFGNGVQYPTTVTVYTCYVWTPPLAGFLFIPGAITIRAVTTEAMQRQQ